MFRFTILTVALALTACGKMAADGDDGRRFPEIKAKAAEERAAWQANLPAAYSYELWYGCGECSNESFRIEVLDGIMVKVEMLKYPEPYPSQTTVWSAVAADSSSGIRSVDQLFDLIEQLEESRPDELDVTYVSERPVPEKIQFDHRERVADDEWVIEVRHFTVTKEGTL